MNTRLKYILMGLTVTAALSFATVSCMGLFSGKKDVINTADIDFMQLREPENGAPTATIKTTEGDIEVVLYPDKAPEAVRHFQELSDSGYYDNTFVFNSEQGVYFAAGSPLRSGDLDEDKPEGAEEYQQEITTDLWPFRGALCSIPTEESGGFWDKLTGKSHVMNGSRFSILNSVDFTDEFKQELLDAKENKTLAETFIELRGVPAFSQQITVFGQTYKGFEVVDKLTSLETKSNEEDLKNPVKEVKIKTIKTGKYKKTGTWALTTSKRTDSVTTATTVTEEK